MHREDLDLGKDRTISLIFRASQKNNFKLQHRITLFRKEGLLFLDILT